MSKQSNKKFLNKKYLGITEYLAKKSNSNLIIDWQKTVYNNYKTPVNLFSTIFDNKTIDEVQIFEPCAFDNDIQFNYKGATYSGQINWIDSEDQFKYMDDILMNSSEKIQFRD